MSAPKLTDSPAEAFESINAWVTGASPRGTVGYHVCMPGRVRKGCEACDSDLIVPWHPSLAGWVCDDCLARLRPARDVFETLSCGRGYK